MEIFNNHHDQNLEAISATCIYLHTFINPSKLYPQGCEVESFFVYATLFGNVPW